MSGVPDMVSSVPRRGPAPAAWAVAVVGWVGKVGLVALAALAGWAAPARAQALPGGGLPAPTPGGLPPERVVVVPVAPPQLAARPFQMGFEFTRVVDEDGDLSHPGQSASAVGLRFIFAEGRALRQHLAFVHHWEQRGPIARRGFRLDLIALGFPIPMFSGQVQLAVEPVLRAVRGEVLFESESGGPSRSLLRIESGFALGLTANYRTWFVILEPLSIDFRYLQLTREESDSGFSRIWSLSGTIGRQF